MSYEEWMETVDALFLQEFGLTHNDFEDNLWMDAYISGESPKSAFDTFCKEMGYELWDLSRYAISVLRNTS